METGCRFYRFRCLGHLQGGIPWPNQSPFRLILSTHRTRATTSVEPKPPIVLASASAHSIGGPFLADRSGQSGLIAAGIDADKLDGSGHACPKCGGRDRFAAFPNINGRGAVHCRQCFTKGSTPSPGDGLSTLQWILGLDFPATLGWLANWLGVKGEAKAKPRPIARRTVASDRCTNAEPLEPSIDFDDLAKQFFGEMSRERCETLAEKLNVERSFVCESATAKWIRRRRGRW